LIAVARSAKVGNGLDPNTALGPVQSHLQYQRLQSAWEEIAKSGATILFRGDVPANGKGFFFPVTLLDNPPEDARYVAQEIFGPIRSVFKYKTVDEAIRRANNTSYGLGASVWGKNSDELQRVARQIEAGTVWITNMRFGIRSCLLPPIRIRVLEWSWEKKVFGSFAIFR
jgi:acyl-CoA reductase-like NAD-dependent aldehyde dehydrogenase